MLGCGMHICSRCSSRTQSCLEPGADKEAGLCTCNRSSDASAAIPETIPLTVPKGTPVQVALDDEVRVRAGGQSVEGHVVEPVYAFDKLVIPVGTIAAGQIEENREPLRWKAHHGCTGRRFHSCA